MDFEESVAVSITSGCGDRCTSNQKPSMQVGRVLNRSGMCRVDARQWLHTGTATPLKLLDSGDGLEQGTVLLAWMI